MATAEAATHQTNRKTQKTFKRFPSPLMLYRMKFCRFCEGHCNPGDTRMLLCILTAMLDTQLRNNELNKQRWSHY